MNFDSRKCIWKCHLRNGSLMKWFVSPGGCVVSDIDELLAKHLAHLFIRDPISLFKEKLELNDEVDTDHFEVHSTGGWKGVGFPLSPMPVIGGLSTSGGENVGRSTGELGTVFWAMYTTSAILWPLVKWFLWLSTYKNWSLESILVSACLSVCL